MKKIIFLLGASVFVFQIASFSQTRVGIFGGVSIATLQGSESEDGSGRGGLMGGLMLEKQIGKTSLAFRPTIAYVQKGETLPVPNPATEDHYLALRYAEFDANFLYYISGVNNAGFYIGAGPSISFNLPSKRITVTDGVKSTDIVQFGSEPINDMRGTDFGANFSTGWRTKSGFLINFNYNRGFRNLVTQGNPGDLKSQYFGVQLGWFLNNK